MVVIWCKRKIADPAYFGGVNEKLLTQHISGSIAVLHWLGLGARIRTRARARS